MASRAGGAPHAVTWHVDPVAHRGSRCRCRRPRGDGTGLSVRRRLGRPALLLLCPALLRIRAALQGPVRRLFALRCHASWDAVRARRRAHAPGVLARRRTRRIHRAVSRRVPRLVARRSQASMRVRRGHRWGHIGLLVAGRQVDGVLRRQQAEARRSSRWCGGVGVRGRGTHRAHRHVGDHWRHPVRIGRGRGDHARLVARRQPVRDRDGSPIRRRGTGSTGPGSCRTGAGSCT